jgi:hypothetical protein
LAADDLLECVGFPGCHAILNYVFAHGWENDFSFAGVEQSIGEKFGSVMSTPLTTEQENAARTLMEKMEKARLESVSQYEKDRLPPFLRRAAPTISGK